MKSPLFIIAANFHDNNSHAMITYIIDFVLSVGSPFNIPIRDRVDPSRVRCYGPGLEPGGARAQVPATFTVDASQAGEAPIAVSYKYTLKLDHSFLEILMHCKFHSRSLTIQITILIWEFPQNSLRSATSSHYSPSERFPPKAA